jgi:two-component system cell cycle response regulator DivK
MAKILLIEDIPDNAELVQRILESTGHAMIHAPDAESGLAAAIKHQPDLILLDLGLPDYDGQTLAGWLRAEPKTAKIPIIAFTAWPEETVRQMASSYGCDGYIGKPISSIQDFNAKITSVLDNRK